MSDDNRISVTITDTTVTAILGHFAAIETLLPFLISRVVGDDSVLLGDKSVAFDEKCAGYMTTNPEFIPSYIDIAEVLKDRAARNQFLKMKAPGDLLASKMTDTFNVIGNEIMMANLGYYSNADEAAKRGRPNAGDVHDDLATRYPGRTRKPAQPAAAQAPVK